MPQVSYAEDKRTLRKSFLVEKRSREILEPRFKEWFDRYFWHGKEQQKEGDLTALLKCKMFTVELKAEENNKHGNFFLETWSNKPRETRGWLYTNQADWLYYHFLDMNVVYCMSFHKLREWIETPRFFACPERRQGKRKQLNEAWGRCVPIGVLQRALHPDFEIRDIS